MDFVRDYGFILILFILPVIFVLQPLFLPNLGKQENPMDDKALKRKKLLIYRQIKELEMEFDMGNINEADYHATRKELKQEVSKVISQLTPKN
ncbi:MAG: c-type cytochrome biogenesis protein CcmI [Candidatus Marinimicrobia bacterium]|jgi:cytochrome c-type biogenesis protein CcmI|nr:c-type cytochrome biogenesis protein CcmI [Candidatus Neomarinimicrobiota bacterium]MDP6610865.1 c-type cytochrome biogenesis protein CcmI [Candidatus Neomarinimicrobiota bacterium]|tara:strand:+ start:19453 stop:19731 length:279 start_codon:yes stop_codon:yes gene_type:complete